MTNLKILRLGIWEVTNGKKISDQWRSNLGETGRKPRLGKGKEF